jgi:phage head maturation protease
MSATDYLLEAPTTTGRIVEGLVVPYDRWLEVDNSREGNFLERWAAGSLRKSFGALKPMRGFFDHGRSKTFDRAPVMNIEEAWETDKGAFFRASLLDGIPGYMVDGIRKGLYGASIGASPTVVESVRFPGKSPHNPKGIEERTYREVQAFDISLTASPAYEEATVTLRAVDYLGSEPAGIVRVALEPVHFAKRPVRDYFADEPHDYLSEDWRL